VIENGIISRYQLWFLVTNFILGGSILILPSSIVTVARQDAWISFILATMIGILFSYILIRLSKRFPNMTIIDISEHLLGKKIGKVIGILYAWFFLHLSVLLISDAANYIGITALRNTPKIVIVILSTLLIYMVIHYGLEVLARSNSFFSYIAAFGFWFSIIFSIPYMDPKKLTPILSEGFMPSIRGAYPVTGFPFAELVVFMMILPFVNKKKHITKVFISGVLVGSFTLIVSIIATILVLNVRPVEMSLFAPFNMVRIINIGEFLTRLEAIISISYMLTVLTKMLVSFYGSIMAIGQVFELTDVRPLIIPLIIITASLHFILNRGIVELIEVAATTWTPYSLFMGVVIPILFLILSYFRKNK